MMAVASAGVMIFALGTQLPTMMLGRAIMGVGGAGALMTAFQAVIFWLPAVRWPFFNGLVLSAGGLGALAATLPTELILHVTDWRRLMIGVAAASLASAALIASLVPERAAARNTDTLHKQLRDIGQIYRDRLFLRVAPLYATTVGGNLAFQSLWAGPWLKDVAHLSSLQIARALLIVAVLQTVGYVIIGWLAGALEKCGIGLAPIIGTGTSLFIVSQAGLLLPSGDARWLVLIGMGSFANINILSYPLLAQNFPAGMMGRVNTALNLFVFLGAFVLQYEVGWLIDWVEPGAPESYQPYAFQISFAVVFVIQVASLFWFLRRAKRC